VIHTASRRPDRQALRSALVLSASRDRDYANRNNSKLPDCCDEVEGERLESAFRLLRRLRGRLQDLLDAISR